MDDAMEKLLRSMGSDTRRREALSVAIPQTGCLEEADLEALSAGQLSAEARETAERHLAGCARCSRLLALEAAVNRPLPAHDQLVALAMEQLAPDRSPTAVALDSAVSKGGGTTAGSSDDTAATEDRDVSSATAWSPDGSSTAGVSGDDTTAGAADDDAAAGVSGDDATAGTGDRRTSAPAGASGGWPARPDTRGGLPGREARGDRTRPVSPGSSAGLPRHPGPRVAAIDRRRALAAMLVTACAAVLLVVVRPRPPDAPGPWQAGPYVVELQGGIASERGDVPRATPSTGPIVFDGDSQLDALVTREQAGPLAPPGAKLELRAAVIRPDGRLVQVAPSGPGRVSEQPDGLVLEGEGRALFGEQAGEARLWLVVAPVGTLEADFLAGSPDQVRSRLEQAAAGGRLWWTATEIEYRGVAKDSVPGSP